ncbi:hypothetical protein IC762_18900 [Bradyrhizobium genosp. L]|uniref:hypothetical protein n=1 Tax=Bradyrhizobium genosp. L TaxID=83637 RepID=UPI0018A29504|nr:hypothetical protein [Bradyrhizobium genosp. L]QPF81872.1 hypothetical protein IC762_18900 [Bradyrhizobium genosp. L]
MKRTLALAVLALTVVARPVQSHEFLPAIPPELAVVSPVPPPLLPYRCTAGPVRIAYHGALYHEPPAIYRGYAYRPYYRYTAARLVPRTYFCVDAD